MNKLEKQSIRVMIYDSTTLKDGWDGLKEDGLALSWKWGAVLYKLRNKVDLVIDATNWKGALTLLLILSAGKKIEEIQFWGHGRAGAAYIGTDRLDIADLLAGQQEEVRSLLLQLKGRMTNDSLIWFRTCATFCGEIGHAFAYELAQLMECRVAGHTHIIGPWQAGLHTLSPNDKPYWSLEEGIAEGTPRRIRKHLWSIPFKSPNGISCLTSEIPEGW